jgi:hypothetical protein
MLNRLQVVVATASISLACVVAILTIMGVSRYPVELEDC